MKNLLLIGLSILLFSACSTKRVFEPDDTDDWKKQGSLNSSLVEIGSNVALLEDKNILSKNDINDASEVTIAENFSLLSSSNGWISSANIDGNLTLQYIHEASVTENFALKKTVAAASVKGNILAVLFADNDIALYSIASKELLFKDNVGETIAIDARITSPYFTGNLVIFSTLNGKVVIVNSKSLKKLRTITVSSEDNFNNILYFNLIDDKIIAGTSHKILAMSKNEVRKKYEIRNIAYENEDIFIATKQGELISLTTDLELNAKLKFPFAHFLGLIVKDEQVYALEKEGYLIVAPHDLSTFKVYDVDIDEGLVFVSDDTFFVDDAYVSVK
ncbi:hypothetical protein JHD48_02150 [Sulfurimonas sp. SAG-AH-194-I05]|nr:hypothetical protein [Sulfurimonas sp. SAG-AH-194-I05]MDF1874530.1 hypothetical protein [Sulfurimonas sp. SAG-AH-194-I05]